MELDRTIDSSRSASHHPDKNQNTGDDSQKDTTPPVRQEEEQRSTSPILSSAIPSSDLSVDFSTIMSSLGSSSADAKIEKRRSNLLKLNEENEKLQRELKAMSERLKAAEEKRARLQAHEEERTGDSSS